MIVKDLVQKLEEKFPAWLQEEYDNTGTQVVFPDEKITGIYICLDAEITTINNAINKNCNMIVSHHPMIFRPVKKINSLEPRSKAIISLIDRRISLFSLHTNFDKIMFNYLSEFTGFTGGIPLIKKEQIDDRETGFGSMVYLQFSISFISVLEQIKEKLNLDFVIYSGTLDRPINSIAFINGAGGGSIEKIITIYNPDCIVTGDVTYHNIKYAESSGTCIIDAGHFGTEIIFKKLLAESVYDIISVNGEHVNIAISDIEKNPFKIY